MALRVATNLATTGVTIFVFTRTIWWKYLLSYPHPDHGYTVPALSRKEREVAVWQFVSATAPRKRVAQPGQLRQLSRRGVARACAILILRTAQSSSHRGYSTFRLDVMMISEDEGLSAGQQTHGSRCASGGQRPPHSLLRNELYCERLQMRHFILARLRKRGNELGSSLARRAGITCNGGQRICMEGRRWPAYRERNFFRRGRKISSPSSPGTGLTRTVWMEGRRMHMLRCCH